MKRSYVLVLFFLVHIQIMPISMVYNFRIAEITRQPIFELAPQNDNSIVALVFDQFQKKYSGSIHQNFVGGLASYIRNFDPNYFRIDGAFSHIHETKNHRKIFSDTETDDLLFTLGRTVFHSDNTILTISQLFGVPTHKIYRLKHIDFGTGQGSLGIQFDGSYAWTSEQAFLFGTRYAYFIPRHARDKKCNNHIFTIGNLADILIAYKQYWNQHGFEFGYSFRSQFGAKSEPCFEDLEQRADYLRSSLYLVYKYKFLIHDIANRFLFNFSIGRDHHPQEFGNKYIATVWASWNVRF